MARLPINYRPYYRTSPGQNPRRVWWRYRKPRFKWEYIYIPLIILLIFYLLHNAQPSFTFEDIMDALNVQNRDRYKRLFTFGCTCVAIVIIVRILRDNKRK